MKSLTTVIILTVGALVVSRCGYLDQNQIKELSSGDFSDPVIETEYEVYSLDTTRSQIILSINATITNTTDQSMYIRRCSNTTICRILDKELEEIWDTVFESYSSRKVQQPLILGPGDSHVDSIEMIQTRDVNSIPEFTMEEVAGVYRLTYWIYSEWDNFEGGNKLWPIEGRISNEFLME